MKMRIELDRGVDGRIPQATREYIHRLAADVNAALRVVYEGKNSVQPLSALQEALDANSAVLRTEAGLLDSQIPPLLKELGVPPQAYEEQLVELHALDKVWSEYMRDFQAWWAFSGKAAVFKFTGRDVDEAVGSAWRAVKSNQVTNSPVANSFSMNGAVGAMLELQVILTRLQIDTSDVAFKSLVPSLEEGEASLPAELSPTLVALLQGATRASSAPKDLLRRHSGRAFTRLDSKLSALGSRVDDIEASLDGKSSALE